MAEDDSEDIGTDRTLLLSESGSSEGTWQETSGTLTGQPGRLAGRYEIVALLGQGGMGHVYKARDVELDEIVALKTLNHELSTNPEAVDRFRAEVKLARRVTHRNVARTYDIGVSNGQHFLTMEFIDGESLAERMRRKPALKLGEAASILSKIGRGLRAAHDAGVVHRDLKPQNVLLAADGRVVISDFGIARAREVSTGLTGRGFIGTPAYMAPEQVEGEVEIDGRADLFALGVMMFELFSGKLPWEGATPLATALKRMVEEPRDLSDLRPDLPPELHRVIDCCLAVDRSQRYTSVREWLEEMASLEPTLGSLSETSVADEDDQSTSSMKRSGRTPRETASDKTVAVIPFVSRGEVDSDHLADGLTEEIIDELSMAAGLKVRPRGAVVGLETRSEDPQRLGRQLGVEVVVKGSLRARGERIRVRVALISVDDGFQLWADRFEGTAADLFDMSIDVAEAVSAALLVERKTVARTQHSADPEAIDLYMRARKEMHLGWHGDLKPAIELFESALDRAPEDPRILGGAATAYARASFVYPLERDTYLSLARSAAKQALDESPRLPEAYLALSTVHRNRGERVESLRFARQILDLAPGYVDAQLMMGQTLLETGPFDTAVAYLEAVRRADPTLPSVRVELARARAFGGDWDSVDSLLSSSEDFGSSENILHFTRARLDLWRRGEERWKDDPPPESSVADDSLPDAIMMMRAVQQGKDIDVAQFLSAIEQARMREREERFLAVMHQLFVEVFMYVDQPRQALVQVEAAARLGLMDAVWTEMCPLLDDIRSEPRFQKAAETIEERAAEIRAER